jgi:hypothetical protein
MGQLSITPVLSSDAVAAAREWDAAEVAYSNQDRQIGAAESAFQEGGAPGPERLARTWAAAAFEAGVCYQKLDDIERRFYAEMEGCGLSKVQAGRWHPRHVLGMRVGAPLPEDPGPNPTTR